jgi:hypothetical protein
MTGFVRLPFADFLARSGASVDDLSPAMALAGDGSWLAGGAVRRVLIGHALDSDFDYFFRDADAMASWESRLPSDKVLIRETEHHKHFRIKFAGSDLPREVQGIKFRWYSSAEEVIDSFDYTITQFCLDGDALVTSPAALWDLGRKRLAIHKVTYPTATMRRMLKYASQGFTACTGCMSELLRQTATNPDAMAHLDIKYVD